VQGGEFVSGHHESRNRAGVILSPQAKDLKMESSCRGSAPGRGTRANRHHTESSAFSGFAHFELLLPKNVERRDVFKRLC